MSPQCQLLVKKKNKNKIKKFAISKSQHGITH